MTDTGTPEEPSKEAEEDGEDEIEVVDPGDSDNGTLALNKDNVCRT